MDLYIYIYSIYLYVYIYIYLYTLISAIGDGLVPATKQPSPRRNFKAQRRAERFSATEPMWSSILEPDIRGALAAKSGRDLWIFTDWKMDMTWNYMGTDP